MTCFSKYQLASVLGRVSDYPESQLIWETKLYPTAHLSFLRWSLFWFS